MAVPRWSANATWFGGPAAVGVALFATQIACGGADSQSSEQATVPSGARNVILISIDSLRPDRLGAYGHGRDTSPALDALAERGVVFEHAIAQAPWTLPSMASMLTGLLPSEHGAVSASTRLGAANQTLAEALQARGYFTVGVVSHLFVGSRYGFQRGFEIFDETQIKGHDAVTSQDLTRRALFHLDEADRTRPFFLWVHYFDPHFTYVRHRDIGFADGYDGKLPERISAHGLNDALSESQQSGAAFPERDLQYVEAVYDEEIAYTDRWIGRLLEAFDEPSLEESTLVIVTADHGEYFLERGRFFHGKDVYEPLVHVPLVIGGAIPPSLRGRRVKPSVEVASIPKTVLRWTGADDSHFRGHDLLAVASGEQGLAGPVLAEGSYAWGDDDRRRAVVLEGWKLIRNLDDDSYELYDLKSDPGERNDLWDREEGEAVAARAALLPHLQRSEQPARAEARAG